MGIYLNPENVDFQKSLNSEIYIDKTELIAYTNKKLNTEQGYICVSRPRRFGKSMAANMLTAYYSRGCDSRELFQGLKIATHPDFEKHLNQYNVIHLNMRDYLTESENMKQLIQFVEDDLLDELQQEFSDLRMPRRKTLVKVLEQAFAQYKIPFVFIIDEWDCIFRVHKSDAASQKDYLDFLRNLLKDKSYIALAYMIGILPIKKYGEHSAINVFYEYSMTDASPIEEFTCFTEQEVRQEFINSIEDGGWEPVVQAIHSSEKLLQATLSGDEETVAKLIEQAYQANVSILKYNNENALSCVISLAYYSAQKNYTLHREMPAGKGFADIVFEPNRNCNLPALIVDRQRSLIMLYLLQGIPHIAPMTDFRLSLRCNKIVQ